MLRSKDLGLLDLFNLRVMRLELGLIDLSLLGSGLSDRCLVCLGVSDRCESGLCQAMLSSSLPDSGLEYLSVPFECLELSHGSVDFAFELHGLGDLLDGRREGLDFGDKEVSFLALFLDTGE